MKNIKIFMKNITDTRYMFSKVSTDFSFARCISIIKISSHAITLTVHLCILRL